METPLVAPTTRRESRARRRGRPRRRRRAARGARGMKARAASARPARSSKQQGPCSSPTRRAHNLMLGIAGNRGAQPRSLSRLPRLARSSTTTSGRSLLRRARRRTTSCSPHPAPRKRSGRSSTRSTTSARRRRRAARGRTVLHRLDGARRRDRAGAVRAGASTRSSEVQPVPGAPGRMRLQAPDGHRAPRRVAAGVRSRGAAARSTRTRTGRDRSSSTGSPRNERA